MKIGYLLGVFPKYSEIFIIRQIESVLMEGNDVVIISTREVDFKKVKEYSPYIFKMYGRSKISFLELDIEKTKTAKRVFFNIISFVRLIQAGVSIKNSVRALNLAELDLKDIDILHVQFLSLAPIATLVNERILKIASIRGKDITSKKAISKGEMRLIKDNYSFFLPVSESLKRAAIDKGISRQRLKVIYSSLDVKALPFSTRSRKQGVTRFAQVGRMVEKKGFELSIDLVGFFKKQNTEINLTIVGDGERIHRLKRKTKNLEIEDSVSFIGEKPNSEVIDVLNKSDFLLVPSLTASDGDSEGIPNVAKEAMALGCVVIISDHSGNAELIDSTQGFVFKEANFNDFVRVALHAVNSSEEKLNLIRRNARRKVERYFDHNSVTPRLLNTYNSLLASQDKKLK